MVFLPTTASLGRDKIKKILIIIFVRLPKEGIDLAVVLKKNEGYPMT